MSCFIWFFLCGLLVNVSLAMPLCDAFVATDADVRALGPRDRPLSKHRGADIKGVDVVKLERLLMLTQGKSFDPKLKNFPLIVALSEEGPWIVRLPPALQEFLAGLDEKQAESWGMRWAEAEEFKLDRYKAGDVVEVLRTLAKLARDAQEAKKFMYLSMAP